MNILVSSRDPNLYKHEPACPTLVDSRDLYLYSLYVCMCDHMYECVYEYSADKRKGASQHKSQFDKL